MAPGCLRKAGQSNADGTVATVKDGNNNVTTLSSWYRGIPRTIQYPATPEAATPTQTAVVNDRGWITSVKDENGFKTCYAYNVMGRMSEITYPSETANDTCDTSAWNKTTLVFEKLTGADSGIPAGHWRQTISTGNARKISYFDAQWRPLVTREYDTLDETGTKRFQRFAYDHEGRTTFTSYPGTSSTLNTGTRSLYDALGRVTAVSQDTELAYPNDVIDTLTEYLPGHKIKVTNPKSQVTTSTFMAFDEPSTDWPVAIDHVGVANTVIGRDSLGRPGTLVRSGGGVSATRSYGYNAYGELCRSEEPETGATLMGYDAGGRLSWSATGLTAGIACDATGASTPVVERKAARAYDARNRVRTLVFADGKGDQSWTYTPDGLPASVSVANPNGNIPSITYSSVTHYTYNRRRLLATEALSHLGNGSYWTTSYGYNANAHLSTQTYASGLAISYVPNALGQPTQAGSYATGVSYYPNGAIKQFNYGNGIVHTMTQNARQLPARSTDCTLAGSCVATNRRLDLAYSYDANANVSAITDHTTAARQTRSMTYDVLDRLTQATSPMFGTASYTYNALDDLTRVTVGATAQTLARDHFYCYETGTRRLTFVRTTSDCVGGPSTIALGYDVQGNVGFKNNYDYAFDFGNRLRSVHQASALQEWYAYDGQGRRVLSCGTSACNYQQYTQAGQPVMSWDHRSGKRTEYVYLGGSLVAWRERPMSGETVTVKYQHTDALGSPIAVTDAAKEPILAEASEYEPYGQVGNRPPRNGPGYTGHVEDAASKLNYMQQRYYDPGIGRFLSVDPVTAYDGDMRHFNRYDYAYNNPYKYTDPDGRAPPGCGSGTCDPPPPPPPVKTTTMETITVTGSRPSSTSAGSGSADPFRPQHRPSFFRLTTFEGLRQGVSSNQAVQNGELTRTVTMPAIIVAGSAPVITPVVAGGEKVAAVTVGTKTGREVIYAACVAVTVCQSGKAPSQRMRQQERLEQMREGTRRDMRRNDLEIPEP